MKAVVLMMVLHPAVLFTQALFTLNMELSVHDRQAALNHLHSLTYLEASFHHLIRDGGHGRRGTGGRGTREEGEGEVGDVVAGNVSRSFPRHMFSVSVAVKGPGMTNRLFRLYNVFFCAPIKTNNSECEK